MNIITINNENIESEDICCAKADACTNSKKKWLKSAINEGLVFKKLQGGGKVFIEYIPAENAWAPIIAKDYMFIDCFWVSGSFKGKGYGKALLDECILDAREFGKRGLVAISSSKKKPFVSDPDFFKHHGFKVADVAKPYFELLYLPFNDNDILPKFNECAKNGVIEEKGIVIYYTNHCPYNAKYIPIIDDIAFKSGIDYSIVKINSKEEAQKSPSPITNFSFFYDGVFLTNEIFSDKKFVKFLNEKGF